ncbi:MAG: class I SAM-dependent rRNA methyltransferase [bacterium]|nr:class I SAM-dependent rRNA methyltransferase [bacterium]
MVDIILKKKRERPVQLHHPWIFSGAIDLVRGKPQPGDTVRVLDAGKQFLAWGHFSPCSEIRIRAVEWDENSPPDEKWLSDRIKASVQKRDLLKGTDSKRLIFGESDHLPGLVADQYNEYLVLQTLTPAMEKWKAFLVRELAGIIRPKAIYERNDTESRGLEGLEPACSVLYGASWPGLIPVSENGLKILVDLEHGQKTGYYLDQRMNRRIVARFAEGRSILDCFSYSGGFSLFCLSRGAVSVTCVDSSAEALDLVEKNMKLNQLPPDRYTGINGNAFEVLRKMRDQGKKLDMIILDPPKLAPSGSHVRKALRAYKDINLLAFKLLNPGGILVTFSCSGGVDMSTFRTMISWACQDAGIDAQIIGQLSQAEDHPIRLSFPESEYLRGLICRVP